MPRPRTRTAISRQQNQPRALISNQQMAYLAGVAQQVPLNQSIVEIGVYQGASLRAMAHINPEHQFFGIDAWGMYGAYPTRPKMRGSYTGKDKLMALTVLRRYTNVKLIQGLSTVVAANVNAHVKASPFAGCVKLPIGMLHIDADHAYDSVKADIAAWLPHLAAGAWVLFDDYSERFPGVVQAVNEACNLFNGGPLMYIGNPVDSLAICRLRKGAESPRYAPADAPKPVGTTDIDDLGSLIEAMENANTKDESA